MFSNRPDQTGRTSQHRTRHALLVSLYNNLPQNNSNLLVKETIISLQMNALHEEFSLLLGEVQRTWRGKLDERLRPLGLSQAKWVALLHLSRSPQAIGQSELASRIGIEGPTLVGLLDRLAKDGYVERRASPSDRRVKLVHLSPKGEQVLQQIKPIASELRAELLGKFTDAQLRDGIGMLRFIKETADRLEDDREG